MFAVMAPSAAAANPLCKVTNLATLAVYGGSGTNLQTAIDAASLGVTLQVQGVCIGNFRISQNVNLKGKTSTAYPKKATLDGNDLGTVVTVDFSKVSLRNLKITGGLSDFGGGIYSTGILRLDGSTIVTGNQANREGGGIFDYGGDLIMNDASSVSGNAATTGGGMRIEGGSLEMNGHAKIANNTATDAGGVYAAGDVTMNGRSSIKRNSAVQTAGGIAVETSLTMNDSSSISGNTAGNEGGGVFAYAPAALNGVQANVNVVANIPDDVVIQI